MPNSHSRVLSSPQTTRIAVTIAWNEPFVGAQPMRPFHSGFVKSSMRVGSWSGVRFSALYTTTRALPDMPTHWLSGDRAHVGTFPVMLVGSVSNNPAFATSPRPPGSCEKNTSAGEFSPSSSIVAAMSPVLPYFTATLMPVTSSNCAMMGETSDSLLPEYTTSVPGSRSRTTSTIFSTSTTFSTGTSCTRTISFSTSTMRSTGISLTTSFSTTTCFSTGTSLTTSRTVSTGTTFSTTLSTSMTCGATVAAGVEPHAASANAASASATTSRETL